MNTSLTASITPQFRMIDGVRIRYAESGGPQERTLLLTSPWPESVFAFAPMWATLAEDARDAQYDAIVEWGIPDHAALQRLTGIQSPTLIIQGDDDLMIPTKLSHLLAGLIPDTRIRIYADAAHGFLFQYPTKVAADVNAFLAREGSIES